MGIGNTTASAALIAAFVGADPVEVTGRGAGVDDQTWAHKVDVVRRALAVLGLRPVLDLGLRLGEGSGAVLVLPVVQAAARVLRDVATFDSAGVSGAKE